MNYIVKSTGQLFKKHLVGGPVQFRIKLQEMGPIFIKIGQYLALRPDILPQEYCNELMLFFQQVTPFRWNEAKKIIREELGKDPSEIFEYINPRPEASGSLAQVHIARLKDGTEVAVKIQRPDILKKVLKDLRRASLIARLMELSGNYKTFSPREVVKEIREWMLQEIDFKIELSNLTRMFQHMRGSTIERVSKPYPEYSSTKVLTAEYLRGISFSELLSTLKSNNESELNRIGKLNINYNDLAANLFHSCLKQIFSYQFFHADLHPGNLIAQSGNKVGFVDFGLCDSLDETVRAKQMRYLTAVYNRNIENMYKAITEILIITDQTDLEGFRQDFFSETGTLFKKRNEKNLDDLQPASEEIKTPLGSYLVNIMYAARKNKLKVPTKILSMYRALLTAETVAKQLSPNVDLGTIGREFFTKIQMEELHRSFSHNNLQAGALNLVTLMRDSPTQLQQLLYEISEGKFALNVNVTEVPKVVRTKNRRAQVLVHAILSVGITILLTIPNLPVFYGIQLTWILLVILLLFYITIYIQLKKL